MAKTTGQPSTAAATGRGAEPRIRETLLRVVSCDRCRTGCPSILSRMLRDIVNGSSNQQSGWLAEPCENGRAYIYVYIQAYIWGALRHAARQYRCQGGTFPVEVPSQATEHGRLNLSESRWLLHPAFREASGAKGVSRTSRLSLPSASNNIFSDAAWHLNQNLARVAKRSFSSI